jgi:general secretion pathway protein E
LTRGWVIPPPTEVCAPVGCLECRNTGYLGRTGVYEMMPVNTRLRGMITANLDLDNFTAGALEDGMQPLRISAATQVRRGLTTVEEVLSVLPAAE